MKLVSTGAIVLFTCASTFLCSSTEGNVLRILTVATERNDRLSRLLESAEQYNTSIEILGFGKEYTTNYIQKYPSGGFKVKLLQQAVESLKEQTNLLIMFVDRPSFKEFDSKIVFSSETLCWPDPSLKSSYPKVSLGNRFLSSKAFIGYAPMVYSMLKDNRINDGDNEQLYYTKIFIEEEKRMKYGIKLDSRSHLFQGLDGAEDLGVLVDLIHSDNETYLINKKYNTRPAVYHGIEKSKEFLNYLGNFIPNRWNKAEGCVQCSNVATGTLPENEKDWPKVLLAFFVKTQTPFFDKVLQKLQELEYPKQLISLWIHNQVSYHDTVLTDWMKKNEGQYRKLEFIRSSEAMPEPESMTTAMGKCAFTDREPCDYYFYVDSIVVFDGRDVIKQLIALKKNVIAPLLVRPGFWWSNFWGAINKGGFYERSRDYNQIVTGEYKGVWNVPLIRSAILFNGEWIRNQSGDLPVYKSRYNDTDMAFSHWMRSKGHFMFISNLHLYGHLLSTKNYETNHLHNDLYNIFENRWDWEQKYIHENYTAHLNQHSEIEEPCNDVFRFPIVSPAYAKEMIEELEHFGKWSGGKHQDSRIAGGYENVPTRDIHMNQIGFEKQWIHMLRAYILPVQMKVFAGYKSDANGYLNFVVKYHPKGQASLRPHQDTSTFTVNIALSTYGEDHEGGGCRFIRQNCSVIDTKLGWGMIHPGRLTHFHEGLATTRGTRYIMVSFVDPPDCG